MVMSHPKKSSVGQESATLYGTCLNSSLQKDSRSYYTAQSQIMMMPNSGEKAFIGHEFIDNRNELAEIDEDSMSIVMDGHKESSKQKYLHKQTP